MKRFSAKTIRLRSPDGKTWGVSVLEGAGKSINLYTREVDGDGEDFIMLNSFTGSFKVKVDNKGVLHSYRMDDFD